MCLGTRWDLPRAPGYNWNVSKFIEEWLLPWIVVSSIYIQPHPILGDYKTPTSLVLKWKKGYESKFIRLLHTQ